MLGMDKGKANQTRLFRTTAEDGEHGQKLTDRRAAVLSRTGVEESQTFWFSPFPKTP
jgi:hypothetical protein